MPSASTAFRSDALVITTSCPIAVTGSLPVCLRVILKSLHEAGTTMDDTLYCIASLPSISVAQSVPTAVGLPSVAGAAAGGAVGVVAGVEAAGAGACIGADAVADGAAPGAAGDDELSLQAASASAQARARTVILMFIVISPQWQSCILGHHGIQQDEVRE